MPDIVLCMVSSIVRMLCMVAIIGGNWSSSCGMSASRFESDDSSDRGPANLIANLVNTVDRVKYGSQRPADGNVVAVWLPVEVIADRPPEIVEIRNVIP